MKMERKLEDISLMINTRLDSLEKNISQRIDGLEAKILSFEAKRDGDFEKLITNTNSITALEKDLEEFKRNEKEQGKNVRQDIIKLFDQNKQISIKVVTITSMISGAFAVISFFGYKFFLGG